MPEWFYRASITTVSCPSVVMLHAFVKKTKDTLEQKLIIARKRMKEVRNG
jgi:phage-related protein